MSFQAKNFDDEVAGGATAIEGWLVMVFQFLPKLPCAFDYSVERFAVLLCSVLRGGEGRTQVSLSGSHASGGTGWVSCSLSPWKEL